MHKKMLSTPEAPAPIGPYSQGVVAGGLLFVSGQVPLDPASGEVVEGDIALQTEQVMKNLTAILRSAKLAADNVVKTTVYMTDLGDFSRMNEVYARYFGKEAPARSAVQVAALPKGVAIEIDVIAAF